MRATQVTLPTTHLSGSRHAGESEQLNHNKDTKRQYHTPAKPRGEPYNDDCTQIIIGDIKLTMRTTKKSKRSSIQMARKTVQSASFWEDFNSALTVNVAH
eukprot:3355694-Amphidinium_carterae.1